MDITELGRCIDRCKINDDVSFIADYILKNGISYIRHINFNIFTPKQIKEIVYEIIVNKTPLELKDALLLWNIAQNNLDKKKTSKILEFLALNIPEIYIYVSKEHTNESLEKLMIQDDIKNFQYILNPSVDITLFFIRHKDFISQKGYNLLNLNYYSESAKKHKIQKAVLSYGAEYIKYIIDPSIELVKYVIENNILDLVHINLYNIAKIDEDYTIEVIKKLEGESPSQLKQLDIPSHLHIHIISIENMQYIKNISKDAVNKILDEDYTCIQYLPEYIPDKQEIIFQVLDKHIDALAHINFSKIIDPDLFIMDVLHKYKLDKVYQYLPIDILKKMIDNSLWSATQMTEFLSTSFAMSKHNFLSDLIKITSGKIISYIDFGYVNKGYIIKLIAETSREYYEYIHFSSFASIADVYVMCINGEIFDFDCDDDGFSVKRFTLSPQDFRAYPSVFKYNLYKKLISTSPNNRTLNLIIPYISSIYDLLANDIGLCKLTLEYEMNGIVKKEIARKLVEINPLVLEVVDGIFQSENMVVDAIKKNAGCLRYNKIRLSVKGIQDILKHNPNILLDFDLSSYTKEQIFDIYNYALNIDSSLLEIIPTDTYKYDELKRNCERADCGLCYNEFQSNIMIMIHDHPSKVCKECVSKLNSKCPYCRASF